MEVAQRLCSGRVVDAPTVWKYYAAILSTYYTHGDRTPTGVGVCDGTSVVTPSLSGKASWPQKFSCPNIRNILLRAVSPSVQLFRSREDNFDSENRSAINRVLLLVSEAQEKIGSESTKRMDIACGLSLHILYLCRVHMKHIFVGAMLTVFKPQIICL